MTSGVGQAAAARAASSALDGTITAVVVTGVAGGCDPSLATGTVVVASALRDLDGGPLDAPSLAPEVRDAVLGATSPAVVGAVASGASVVDDPTARARLAAAGAVAVETEAAAWAAACFRTGTALAVVRAVLDTPSHPLGAAADLVALGDDGPSVRRVVRLAARPAAWTVLLRLALQAARAESQAAAGAVAAAAALFTLSNEEPAANR